MHDQIELSKKEYSDEHLVTVDLQHLSWKFLNCPYEAVDATLMYKDDKLVGRSIRQFRPFHLSQTRKTMRGATISDLLISKESRNALSTINLIKKGSELNELDLILHGSNKYSLPIYSKLLKYPIAFSLSFKAVPIRIARPLKKYLGYCPFSVDILTLPLRVLVLLISKFLGKLTKLRLSNETIPTNDLNEIHIGFRKIAGAHFQRDAQFFGWRYKEGPIFNADILGIKKDNKVVGYVAHKYTEFEGIKWGLVIDIQICRELKYIERAALKFGILAENLKYKVDAIGMLANFNNNVLSSIFSFPFLSIPNRFLPHPNPIFVLSNFEDEKQIDELKNTFYTLADMDYF
jgi:hypothetical protein